MVCIFGCQCGCWDLRTWRVTGMGLGALWVGVAGRKFGHTEHAKYTNKAQQSRRYRWSRCWREDKRGINKGLWGPFDINQTQQQQERGRNKPKRATENPKGRPAKMHITAHQFCNSNKQKNRNDTGKASSIGQGLY